ncbi:dipeptide ABC transporter ATP-binding protein [Actinacidiphila guanduensis]|uniref:Peptide/nickel transport system ATP-binding protein/peptide/nickel transport system ATP-binding protein n=1 Tax=Actinacidiphila guanduensis TaxID=310781 RepID=A0A1H0CC74_9ACTN|nr:ABC transporter ATP-binding protein [Actinacidiphila guanduensis]SDN55462.1 peptide/nickel transport system ATP-binding protein/peptide/nickel transport system ATP-binding protein [Actinacidiphila guanduensis]
MPPLLDVRNLTTHIRTGRGTVRAVQDVSFTLEAGETLGLVGESGCGKSMTGLSLLGLLPPGGTLVEGSSVRLDGRELVGLPDRELRTVRGNDIAMVFQDPMTSLDPTKTIGHQVAEPVLLHRGVSRAAARERAVEVLGLVGLPQPRRRLSDYPHQLSGGQRQRALIAMALANEPRVLIADEPTTALDVTIQAQILALLADLRARLGMAMILITHDMGVTAGNTDRVNVMYAGRIAESTGTDRLFSRMRHPYTQRLLASVPRLTQDPALLLPTIPGLPPDLADPPTGCRFADRCPYATARCRAEEPQLDGTAEHRFACWHPVDGPAPAEIGGKVADAVAGAATGGGEGAAATTGLAEGPAAAGTVVRPRAPEPAAAAAPLLEARGLVREYPLRGSWLPGRDRRVVHAVSDVSFTLARGETFGLVGESGCGKTTLGRLLVGLDRPDAGAVTLEGTDIGTLRGGELRRRRRDLQMVFQDPFSSLDPRMRVSAVLREPLRIQGIGTAREQRARVAELMAEVGLPERGLDLFPHEFSGGQRQRVGLARALALTPKVIVADEPVSALDVSVRAQVLNLMKRLQAAHGLSYVVISHDLAVVRHLADRIGVMYLGRLVEVGTAAEVHRRPAHPYTAGLLAAVPVPDPAQERAKRGAGIGGELPDPAAPPSGCRFRTRCPLAQERCAREEPALRSFGPGHTAACHFPLVAPAADSPSDVAAGRP